MRFLADADDISVAGAAAAATASHFRACLLRYKRPTEHGSPSSAATRVGPLHPAEPEVPKM